MNKYFDFKDINLIPRMGIVNSRSECDTTVQLGNNSFMLPVYPSNMESVVDIDVCETLAENQYFYTMHRFFDDQIEFIKYFKSKGLITSISVGVNDKDYKLIEDLIKLDLIPDYITIDIAHGHSIKMQKFLEFIKILKDGSYLDSYIIAGNISTIEGAKDLYLWGANAVKLGIGNGSPCTTYMETKMGSRGIQASILRDISECVQAQGWDLKIVSDGGITERGEIPVALTMGADMVMSGRLFTGLEDSPGELVETEDGYCKPYWGSASQHQSEKSNRIEGCKHEIKLKGKTFLEELQTIEESMQSAISYAGGQDLTIFHTTDYIVKN